MSRHTEWLSLIEVSGPFLTVPILEKAFPQGMESIETPRRARLRSAYDEWCEAIDDQDSLLSDLHSAWIWIVLTELLEYDSYSLISNLELSVPLSITSPEQIGLFMPDWVVKSNHDGNPRLLISVLSPETSLETVQHNDGWPNSFIERMTLLCRTSGVRLGLVTNGERWMLINAPIGETSSHASWYSRLWFQEPVTLKSFQSLLGVRRCFGPLDETLEALLEESLKHQDDVTDTLGEQVRRAVEVLIQCLDKADQDRNRELLQNVSSTELYEAGLSIMMRLVFLLCAEERGLLLLGDHFYDQHYAISTLRSQLVEEATLHGPEILERRYDAWARLLAVFRMVYGGIDHVSLRLPALGGSLFDPDRFPFLEGRHKGTEWLNSEARPLPIDNRTVLLLLESLQVLQQHDGALLLSYRALDVEQIGHVYEGLLEQTVTRVPEVTLGLIGSQKAKNPNVSLNKLELELAEGERNLLNLIKEATGRSVAAIRNAINRSTDDEALTSRLLAVCGGDVVLVKRILPFMHLIRTDAWNDPIVYLANAFVVNIGVDRRETGTHYTPKLLTERIVSNTLEPLVFNGPAEGKQREDWVLKFSSDLLGLKICDPAMGSGAFLVQSCRWLAERLVESWAIDERNGKSISIDGEVLNELGFSDPLPKDLDERILLARRLIAEKCLYGVDVNPLAVELSKLSIWLITMSKGRPFGFLDHNLRHGDSLLGINHINQLNTLCLQPEIEQYQQRLFGEKIENAVKETVKLRNTLYGISVRDIHDVESKAKLNKEMRYKIKFAQLLADAMIGLVFSSKHTSKLMDSAMDLLADSALEILNGNEQVRRVIQNQAEIAINADLPKGKARRNPFHWPLEFPEVFIRENGGFDAILGNPPFKRGKDITGILGLTYREYLVLYVANGVRGSADLVVYFFLRSNQILRQNGCFGLLATNTITEGDTREVGLDKLLSRSNTIYNAIPNYPWPGKASVMVSQIHLYKGIWTGEKYLSGVSVSQISSYLSNTNQKLSKKLASNSSKSYQGSNILGLGFTLSDEDVKKFIEKDIKNTEALFPYLGGQDLNSDPKHTPSRWVINFWDWPIDRTANGSWLQSTFKSRQEWIKDGVVPYDYPDSVAADFPDLLEILRIKVKPERENKKRKQYRDQWWQFGEKQKSLYSALGRRGLFVRSENLAIEDVFRPNTVLCQTMTSKYLAIAVVPNNIVFSHKLVVFTLNTDYFALLQSTIHEIWARKYGGTLETRMSYTPSDAFETFPFPDTVHNCISIGKDYLEQRAKIMIDKSIGLTALYNEFHCITNQDTEIQKLRKLHSELDIKVLSAYGWEDIELKHEFREVTYLPENDRERYTISDESREEILDRLLKLNHQRYEEESPLKDNMGKHIIIKSKKTKQSFDEQNDLLEFLE